MRGGRFRAEARWGVAVLSVCAMSMCALPAEAAPITIDNFSAANAAWPKDQSEIGDPEVEDLPGSSINLLGEVRKTSLHDFSPGGGISRIEIGVFPSQLVPSFLEYVSSVNTDAAARLRYDGDPNADGLNPDLNLDMTLNPIIQVTFSQFDYASSLPMDVSVTLSDGTSIAMLSQQLAHEVPMPTPETLAFDFSTRAGLVNFADIDWIEIDFDPGAAADFRVTSISAAPEPAGLAFLTLSILLCGRRRGNTLP